VQTSLLVAAISVTIFLPIAVEALVQRYDSALRLRARATPLVIGAKGNRFDVVLSALYFRTTPVETTTAGEARKIRESGLAQAIPIHTRYTARGFPLVGTTLDYFDFRRLSLRRGHLPRILGQAVLGAQVAQKLNLSPGDSLPSDPQNLYNLAAAYPLKLHIVGVLQETGSSDDDAVFIDVQTAWVIDGIGHGHQDLTANAKNTQRVEATAALPQYQEITRENLASFHRHGDPDTFPLTAILAIPQNTKSSTLLKARTHASETAQILVPTEVIGELMSVVLRIQRFLNANFVLVLFSTLLFLTLIGWLSQRMRHREFETMHRIGCHRSTVIRLLVTEWALIFLASSMLAGAGILLAVYLLPNLILGA
jgi:putative ABC transport system permease protein